ncbi:MAG TPA: hypothetical protein PKD88_01730 [Nitrosomonas sp.]|nr:hypothetical protein [Nitrosomonas sp.]HMW19710.1 hypothetical protein [Nitrosomonas sp.]HMW68015.1 hypothetical protein [Nitrosomonas sp.]HMY60405.1 hypothetical protein [Nitrosomonas sp.]HMY89432.1 hypothetical protein [Nitrosomonas sp.]
MPKIKISFEIILPVLLIILLLVPYTLNRIGHSMYGIKQFPPVILMKLPVDHSAVNLPQAVKELQSFNVALELDTSELIKRTNDIIGKSSHGTGLQGLTGQVLPGMQAEMAGANFQIDNPGPHVELFSSNRQTLWTWTVIPKKTGRQSLSLLLHLETMNGGQQAKKVVELAEIQMYVENNPEEWLKQNAWWMILISIALGYVLVKYRSDKKHKQPEEPK